MYTIFKNTRQRICPRLRATKPSAGWGEPRCPSARAGWWSAIAVVAVAIAGYVNPASANPASHADAAAIAAMAYRELANIDADSGLTLASMETVIALHEAGKVMQARALLEREYRRARAITDPEKKAQALTELAVTLPALGQRADALEIVMAARQAIAAAPESNKAWDLAGKVFAVGAALGDQDEAISLALAMPVTNEALGSIKARTLHDVALAIAKRGDLRVANTTLEEITTGIAYYQSTARARVAAIAGQAGERALADTLLDSANIVAVSIDNGYFRAGALRRIAVAYASRGNAAQARQYFEAALGAAPSANSAQEHARALSRVATSLADYGNFQKAREILPLALARADEEASENLRLWCYYEIAGSAAFAADFEFAQRIAARIPDDIRFSGSSLKYATERDIAWGLARNGDLERALEAARSIAGSRERVQAFARIARAVVDSSMNALPRYL